MRIAGIALLLLFLLLAGISPAQAQGTLPDIPTAPSDVHFLGGSLRWSDNSDDELGFRIFVELRSDLDDEITELTFEAGANETSYSLPLDAQLACPERVSGDYAVVAFNERGSSEPATHVIRALCPGATETPSTITPAVATPVSPQLPPTGVRSEGDDVWLVAALGLGGAVIAGAGVVVARRR
jgi:hypothetical protein